MAAAFFMLLVAQHGYLLSHKADKLEVFHFKTANISWQEVQLQSFWLFSNSVL